ncbi:hypothetical protein ACSSS7_004911 [Eimeria intestinalis]
MLILSNSNSSNNNGSSRCMHLWGCVSGTYEFLRAGLGRLQREGGDGEELESDEPWGHTPSRPVEDTEDGSSNNSSPAHGCSNGVHASELEKHLIHVSKERQAGDQAVSQATEVIVSGEVELVINVPGKTNTNAVTMGYLIRRAAIDAGALILQLLQQQQQQQQDSSGQCSSNSSSSNQFRSSSSSSSSSNPIWVIQQQQQQQRQQHQQTGSTSSNSSGSSSSSGHLAGQHQQQQQQQQQQIKEVLSCPHFSSIRLVMCLGNFLRT